MDERGRTWTVGRRMLVLALALAFAAATGCGGGNDDGPRGEGEGGVTPETTPPEGLADSAGPREPAVPGAFLDSVAVVFSRSEEPQPVLRSVPADSTGGPAGLRAALERLLRGPTAEERSDGIDSWFSEEMAGVLDTVTVDSAGRAVVGFRDLPSRIPSASSSAGSRMLLQQLDGTVFRFPEIQSVEYRMEGSCARFWEWLQYECRVVERPGTVSYRR